MAILMLQLGVCIVTVIQLVSSQSDPWSRTDDVHGPGGVPQSVSNLEACKQACIADSNCVAIDYEPNNAGKECWILQVSYTGPTTEPGHIQHYGLDRSAIVQFSCEVDLLSNSCCECPTNDIEAHVLLNAVQAWRYSYCGGDNWRNYRGVNTFLINVSSCSVEEKSRYDTEGDASAATALSTYLQEVDNGKVVAILSANTASGKLSNALQTLQSLGMDVSDVKYRGSFAGVVQKGYPEKTVLRKVLTETLSNANPAALKATIAGYSEASLSLTAV